MALRDVLADPTKQLNFTAEISWLNPDDYSLTFAAAGYVDWGDILDQGAADSFSVEVLFNSSTTGTDMAFAAKRSTGAGWLLYKTSGGTLTVIVDDSVNQVVYSAGSITAYLDGNWHRLSMVVNRTEQKVHTYIDGTEIGTGSASIAAVGSLTNALPLRIGTRSDGALALTGSLDDLRFWSTIRTLGEIQTNKTIELEGDETGLALYAKMNEGVGPTVYDSTANARNGTITSGTWTQKTGTEYVALHGFSTTSSETPKSTIFHDYLIDPGTVAEELSQDVLFSGPVNPSLGTVRVRNSVTGVPGSAGVLDKWLRYTFAGRDLVVKCGEKGAAYSTFETVRAAKIRFEPQFSAEEITFDRQSVMERLDVPLVVDRYPGIPHSVNCLTATGQYSAPYVAAYSLTTFTAMIRFNIPAPTASTMRLMDKQTAATNRNFTIAINATSGVLFFVVSLAGVSTVIAVTTASYADGLWHTAVAAVLDKTDAYLMVDGTVVDRRTPASSVDTQNAAVASVTVTGQLCDARLYNTFFTPDEARAISATRSEGTETGCVGCWRMDDNGGGTINDYSTTANDATLAGVENTDYRWDPSDLGEPQLAGLPMPVAHGQIYNAPATLVDSVRERFRYSDRRAPSPTIIVKDQGSVLTVTTDYTITAGSGVIDKVTQADEPMSFDFSVAANTESRLDDTVSVLLQTRGGLAASALDLAASFEYLHFLIPLAAGYFTNSEQTAAGMLADILAGSAAFIGETAGGLLSLDALTPPVGLGPYDEPVLELRGGATITTSGVSFGDIADETGSCSVAAWINNQRTEIKSLGVDSYAIIVDKSNASVNDGYRFYVTDEEGLGWANWDLTPNTLESAARLVKRDTWYFVVAVYDHVAKTRTLYMAEEGDQLLAVATQSGITGTPANSTGVLNIGRADGSWCGAIAHLQVWSKALSLAEAQAVMDTPPVGTEANLDFYAPLNEGTGTTVTELVASASGTIGSLGRWSPQVTVDLDAPGVEFDQIHDMIPAWKITLGFARNYMPMNEADIDAAVSQTDALKLKQPHQSVILENADTQADFLDARHVTVMSPYQKRDQAERVAQLLMSRLGQGRQLIALTLKNVPMTSDANRLGMVLRLTDEVLVKGAGRFDLPAAGKCFRVVSRNVNYADQSVALVLWG